MRFFALLFSVFFGLPSIAQSYFGEFGQGPSGEFRDGYPWQEFVLGDNFEFLDPNGLHWSAPAGAVVNGASIPPMFWSFIGGPFTGRYLKASVIHDHYVVVRTRTAHDTHRNFYYGMRANDVPAWQAKTMYWAVATFGEYWELANPNRSDISAVETPISSVTNRAEQLSVAIARQSLLEVARNLKTSDGEILRVTNRGPVEASLDAIDIDAFGMQRTLAMTVPLLVGDITLPTEMMLGFSEVADSAELTFDSLPEWPGGKIPISGETVAGGVLDMFKNDPMRDFMFNLEVPG